MAKCIFVLGDLVEVATGIHPKDCSWTIAVSNRELLLSKDKELLVSTTLLM